MFEPSEGLGGSYQFETAATNHGSNQALFRREPSGSVRVPTNRSQCARVDADHHPARLLDEHFYRALDAAGAGETRVGSDECDVECLSERDVGGVVGGEVVA